MIISYGLKEFHIHLNYLMMIDNFKSKDLYALLVNVNQTWYVKEFTHEHDYITRN